MVLFGGRAWFYSGGMHGFIRGGACVVLFGGHAWFYSGGMHGFIQGGHAWFYSGVCMVLSGGHAWFYLGGPCVVLFGGAMCGFIWGGMCGFIRGGGHAWFFQFFRIQWDTVNERAVRILLECILVLQFFCWKLHENERIWILEGGGESLLPPLDPPMSRDPSSA